MQDNPDYYKLFSKSEQISLADQSDISTQCDGGVEEPFKIKGTMN